MVLWGTFKTKKNAMQCGFCEKNDDVVVPSTAAPFSELQGNFKNMTIWNFIISDAEEPQMVSYTKFNVES